MRGKDAIRYQLIELTEKTFVKDGLRAERKANLMASLRVAEDEEQIAVLKVEENSLAKEIIETNEKIEQVTQEAGKTLEEIFEREN